MVEGLKVVLSDGRNVGDQQVETTSSQSCNHQFTQEHNDCTHATYNGISEGIGPSKFETVLSGIAEILASNGNLDVGLSVDELDDTLNTGEEALQAFDDILEALVRLTLSFGLTLDYFYHHLQELHDGEEQCTEGQTTKMEPE